MYSTARTMTTRAARRALLNGRLPNRASATPTSRLNAGFQHQALAILVPQRGYATEPTTRGSDGASFPPPGFNAEQAKRPLPKQQPTENASTQPTPVAESIHKIDKASPTAVDKTKANEDMSLSELAAEKAASKRADEKLAQDKKEEAPKKLTIGQKVKKELRHYWDGSKLLATEVKISSKLALKMAAGYELSRRENRQLQRTVQDLGRLVPFSVFVIVPFAELLLPVALKLFPNMLPSTFEGKTAREAKANHLRNTRKQVSSFLRETLRETGLPISAINTKKEEFTNFFRKVRATGEQPSHEDVVKVCKVFKDDLTLDNLSRPQLVAMCRYMNLNTFGTDAMLRYQIRHRMRQIKRDDKAISFEGVDSLSVPELQMACASRGLRTHGLSPTKLREDLQMWLDLRLKAGVPSTLLVLSNAYMYTSGKDAEIESQIDALQAVLSSIPEELFHEIELEVHTAEGAATNKQRLEVLKEQQELIEEENEQQEENKETGREVPKDTENIDEKPKTTEKKAESSSAAAAGGSEGESEGGEQKSLDEASTSLGAKEAEEAGGDAESSARAEKKKQQQQQ